MLEKILKEQRRELLREWTVQLAQVATGGRISSDDLDRQAADFLQHMDEALQSGSTDDISHASWNAARDPLRIPPRTPSCSPPGT